MGLGLPAPSPVSAGRLPGVVIGPVLLVHESVPHLESAGAVGETLSCCRGAHHRWYCSSTARPGESASALYVNRPVVSPRLSWSPPMLAHKVAAVSRLGFTAFMNGLWWPWALVFDHVACFGACRAVLAAR
jgi:hypothetical protein